MNNPLSLNLYTYVENNPLRYVDPTGNRKNPVHMSDGMGGISGGPRMSSGGGGGGGGGGTFRSSTPSSSTVKTNTSTTTNIKPNTSSEVKGNTLQKNKEAGQAYEREVLNNMLSTHNNVQQQITVKTESGVRTRIDILGQNKQTGKLECVECKASPTAPLTPNQQKAFPEILRSGASVVGNGKPPYTNGYQIPPTQININRKN